MSFDQLPAEQQRFLWAGRVRAGCVSLLGGDQSAGKSTLAAQIAAAVAQGGCLPGGPELLAQRVAWLTREESSTADVRPRLRLAGAPLAMVKDPQRLLNGKRRRLTLPLHAPELLRFCRGEGIGLLIFDPITSFVDERILPESGTAARAVCECLAQIGDETGAASLVIKHPKKGASGSLIERVSGSREWIQVPRSVLFLVTPSDTTCMRVLATLKPGPPVRPPALLCEIEEGIGAGVLSWRGEVDFNERSIGVYDDSPAEKGATLDAIEFLKATLGEERQLAKDLLRWGADAMLTPNQLRRAREKLRVTVYHEGGNSERLWFWQKPEGGWPS
jgi:hypothetical protein